MAVNNIETRFLTLKNNIRQIAEGCGRNSEDIVLVAVSKKQSCEKIKEAIHAGVKTLGENYIQEAVDKIKLLGTETVAWHFIGHLQSNKAKYAVKYFDLIHSVDKLKLAKEIDKQAGRINKIQKILLQINISEEDSKSGANAEDALSLAWEMSKLSSISLTGLMGMPPFYNDPEKVRPYFRAMADIRDAIDNEHIPGVVMEHLSMGMSGDFLTAIEEGSTMVRIGTAIFGARQ